MAVDWQDLAARSAHREIAAALIGLEQARGIYDFDRLADDPGDELSMASEVDVHLDNETPGDCGVDGYYRPRDPVTGRAAQLVVHPSSSLARDNFTVLHEFAHHLQRTHLAWADVWCLMPEREADLLNERVADAIASEILVPRERVTLAASEVSASTLAQAYSRARAASRSAVAYRALEDAAPSDDVVVAVVDLRGKVIFARSAGSVMAPRRAVVQECFAKLVKQALAGEGRASGSLAPGLVAASGYVQEDLTATVALDASGEYAFAVVRPLHRYVASGWHRDEIECANPACGRVFEPDADTRRCRKCEQPCCPECGTCSCPPEATATCSSCWTVLSVAERMDPSLHECS